MALHDPSGVIAEPVVERVTVVLEDLVAAQLVDHVRDGTRTSRPCGWTSAGGARIILAMTVQGRRALQELLDEAAARIERLTPAEAAAAVEEGALLVDIRSDVDRERDGVVPGSLHIPRTVLEWRVDPESEWRSPHVAGLEERIVLLCDHGCSSTLAAATLVELGFSRAGDVVGGFAGWREAGLPVRAAPARRGADELPGMGAPEPA
jgi:rhodanese-related sulfurtransferase